MSGGSHNYISSLVDSECRGNMVFPIAEELLQDVVCSVAFADCRRVVCADQELRSGQLHRERRDRDEDKRPRRVCVEQHLPAGGQFWRSAAGVFQPCRLLLAVVADFRQVGGCLEHRL